MSEGEAAAWGDERGGEDGVTTSRKRSLVVTDLRPVAKKVVSRMD